ncbi:dUTP diphosphatase [Candidatus Xianfuyuplasma coldseepsis]|uniref:dUTP diphosphatase n=1 Tax=Candidatus Xianfuyuplasma coldseepsis TaxID=2782163 RepID=A0A7L7KT34_9MOLU|nr:dUTP diphosphatase [Xianfuyuplasma coldseepsis]QMS85442.1 dUTP diphosphatase [Xianfuyuplasma coldseepsis]
MRGFEKAKGFEHLDIPLPERKTEHSAGYDISIIDDIMIPAGAVAFGKTGLKAFMQDGEVLKIYPRSSLAKNYHLTLGNNVGIVDKDYYNNPDNDGHIMISLRNFGQNDIMLRKGERVAQAIFEQYLTSPFETEVKDRRQGGFGSTGK